MLTLGAWLHDIDPFVWRIRGDFGVRWYGLAYIAGFVVAWAALRALSKRGRILLSQLQVTDFIFAVVLGVLLGGRLGYVLIYQPSLLWTFDTSAPWWGVLAIHKGGMASHGGMLGVAIACMIYARRARVPALHLMDLLALTAPIGLLFGRLANFVNGELLGRVVAGPGEVAPRWSVRYPHEILERRNFPGDVHLDTLTPDQQVAFEALLRRVSPDLVPDLAFNADARRIALARIVHEVQRGAESVARDLEPLLSARHPSQLYQAGMEGLLVLGVLWAVWRKPRRPGVVVAWFLMTYGLGRIVTEVYRLPDAHLRVQRPLGLTYGQWLSLAMVAIGAALLAWIFANRARTTPIGGWMRRPENTTA